MAESSGTSTRQPKGAVLRRCCSRSFAAAGGKAEFTRQDGSRAWVSTPARVIEEAPIPADAAIVTQIEAGRSGLLVNDPRDLKECGAALTGLLLDRRRAVAMGKRAHQRVGREYLAQVYLGRYLNLFTDLMSALLGSATGGPEARRWSTAG